ncbi:MAG: hypothetical protein WCS18_12025 [Sphaerochaetaceae bacterium]|jgi:hypothetical protein
MPEDSIQWKTTIHKTFEESVSQDNRWCVSREQTNSDNPKMHLSNYELLLPPCGSGKSIEECFEKFIANCDRYTELLAKIKAVAMIQLDTLRPGDLPE